MTSALGSTLVLLAALQASPPGISLAPSPGQSRSAGPDRAFGGQTLKRLFRVEGEGKYELAWQARIFRGIIQQDTQQVAAPSEVTIQVDLPAVRARVEMVQELELRRDGKVVASAGFPLALFPNDILADLGGPDAVVPPVGLYDPRSVVAPVLVKAGVRFELIKTDLQLAGLDSRIVIVAPDQADTIAEPMEGICRLVKRGGTAIFLEQTEPQSTLFTEERPMTFPPCAATIALPLAKKEHPLFRDILEGDLSNWAGGGAVASRSLAWPAWTGYRAWLVSDDAAGGRPLLMEWWTGQGRVISCQLDVGARLAGEPAAQLLMRNIVAYARSTPPPAPSQTFRMAIPRAAVEGGKFDTAQFIPHPKEKDLAGAVGILVLILPASGAPPDPGFNLAKFLASGGRTVLQSPFDEDMLAALNDLVRRAWGDDLRSPPPKFRVVETGRPPAAKIELDYSDPLAWGIAAQHIERAFAGSGAARSIEVEQETPGFHPLARPAFLVEFKRAGSRLLLSTLPVPDEDHPERARVLGQFVTNASQIQQEQANQPPPE